jgi:thiol-disulfide isomerase/thioredoxin
MDKVKIFISGVGILVVGIIIAVILNTSGPKVAEGQYDSFAQCLTDSGTTFFGAFWCPHCQNQKKMFGSSAKLLPYVECSTVDGKGKNQICIDEQIDGYPTWEFPDGSRLSGEISLEVLAEKSACVLPAGEVVTPVESGVTSTDVIPQ